MGILQNYMTKDHKACDDQFASMEQVVASDNWAEAKDSFEQFASDLNHHFDIEEEVMFPAFETRSEGAHCNPTPVMIMEHTQMRNLVEQMREDIQNKNKDHFFGLSETLMMTLQQHNMKEEQIMYSLVDTALGDDSRLLLNEMKSFPKKG